MYHTYTPGGYVPHLYTREAYTPGYTYQRGIYTGVYLPERYIPTLRYTLRCISTLRYTLRYTVTHLGYILRYTVTHLGYTSYCIPWFKAGLHQKETKEATTFRNNGNNERKRGTLRRV